MKVTMRKIVKAFIPYGIIWLYNRNVPEQKLRKRKLLKFEVHLADHCNLNCKGCDHFSPLADKKYLELSVFERDCKRIFELTKGHIESLGLLGGEPLLHTDIRSFFTVSRKYFKKCKITVTTNGTLLLKQDEDFWISCSENNISIQISLYPLALDIEEIKRKGNKYNVNISIPEAPKTMWKFPFDIEGNQDKEDSFKKCFRSNVCIFLDEGKLYTCPMIPNIKHFNKYFDKNLEICEKDYIDIYRARNISEILSFLHKPVPFCRYCKINNAEYGLAWDRSRKEITEWV
jgi:MoaA/NifB/PqqE/SkfB family radical SAM enzyme